MKIAIVQDHITYGGRIVVLAEIIRYLNHNNIRPVLMGFSVDVTMQGINDRYAVDAEFDVFEIKFDCFSKFTEIRKVWFNFIFNFYAYHYDLIINSNNSTCLSRVKNRIVYLHYPRKKRVLQKEYFKFNSDIKLKTRIAVSMDYFVSRLLYNFDNLPRFRMIVANSNYTRSVINELYTIEKDKQRTLYPPVDLRIRKNKIKDPQKIISIGRISASKNQLMQLGIARELKTYDFHIIGFATPGNAYYNKCLEYVKEHQLNNIYFHTNLSYEDLISMMDAASLYLHTMENEPFGITTVQAISSGCVPVVHDSGGQREIVPYDNLRFRNIEEAVQIIQHMKQQEVNTLISKLQAHMERFSKERFHEELDGLFKELIH
jgi:glycosyltransferase involved in cell wall biosynthesis